MTLENRMAHLERKAISALRNVHPDSGTFHDYANIVHTVQQAHKALGRAYLALSRASETLDEIKERQ